MTPAELLQRLTARRSGKIRRPLHRDEVHDELARRVGTPRRASAATFTDCGRARLLEAAERALAARENNPDCELHRWFEREGCPACPECGQPLARPGACLWTDQHKAIAHGGDDGVRAIPCRRASAHDDDAPRSMSSASAVSADVAFHLPS